MALIENQKVVQVTPVDGIQVIGYGTIYWPNTDFPMSRGAQKLCMDVEIYVKNYDMICNRIT